MPSRLRYEGTGLLIPQYIVTAKEAQLRLGMAQFQKRDNFFSNGLCIIFRWAFVIPVNPNNKSLTIFRVELLHLSTGETYCRSWEMKDGALLSDQELNHPRPFVLTGFLYPEWYQELYGNALYSSKNKSLEKALSVAIHYYKMNYLTIKIYKAACKISLPWGGKEYGGVEYKLVVRAADLKNVEREYDLIVEVDPMEERYKKNGPHKRAGSLRKTRYGSPLAYRDEELVQAKFQMTKETNLTKLEISGMNFKKSPIKALKDMVQHIYEKDENSHRPKSTWRKDGSTNTSPVPPENTNHVNNNSLLPTVMSRTTYQLHKKRITAPSIRADAERAMTYADETTVYNTKDRSTYPNPSSGHGTMGMESTVISGFNLDKKRDTAPMIRADAERALTYADECTTTLETKPSELMLKSYDLKIPGGMKLISQRPNKMYSKLPKIDLNKTFVL